MGALVFYGISGALIAWTVSFTRRHRPRVVAEREAAQVVARS